MAKLSKIKQEYISEMVMWCKDWSKSLEQSTQEMSLQEMLDHEEWRMWYAHRAMDAAEKAGLDADIVLTKTMQTDGEEYRRRLYNNELRSQLVEA